MDRHKPRRRKGETKNQRYRSRRVLVIASTRKMREKRGIRVYIISLETEKQRKQNSKKRARDLSLFFLLPVAVAQCPKRRRASLLSIAKAKPREKKRRLDLLAILPFSSSTTGVAPPSTCARTLVGCMYTRTFLLSSAGGQ